MNPVAQTGPWSLGTLVGFPVGLLLTVGLGLLAYFLWRRLRFDDFDYDADRDMARVLAILLAVLSLAGLFTTAAAMWPYDSEFHQWRPVSGQVEDVSKRLIADGKAMSERYVVVIGRQAFAVDDTRASLIETGDVVNLSCKREWEYASAPGWACRWNGSSR